MWSMQSPKQKILIITPHYSPAIRPRAFRWTTVAEKLVQRGHEVQVLCSKHITRKGGPEVMNGVRIYRAGYNSLKEIYYHLFAVGKRRGAVRPVWQEEVAAALDNAQEQTGGISRFLRTFEPVAKTTGSAGSIVFCYGLIILSGAVSTGPTMPVYGILRLCEKQMRYGKKQDLLIQSSAFPCPLLPIG